jgi:hypothetical protein
MAALSFARIAAADVLKTFEIRNAADPTQMGGVFDGGKGAYFGSFTVDETLYAAGDFADALLQVSLDTTAASGFDPGTYTVGAMQALPFNLFGTQGNFVELDTDGLILQFLEPATTFAGGVVFEAIEPGGIVMVDGTPVPTSRKDTTASAVALDPAAIASAPEPDTLWLLTLGIGGLAAVTRTKRTGTRSILVKSLRISKPHS